MIDKKLDSKEIWVETTTHFLKKNLLSPEKQIFDNVQIVKEKGQMEFNISYYGKNVIISAGGTSIELDSEDFKEELRKADYVKKKYGQIKNDKR